MVVNDPAPPFGAAIAKNPNWDSSAERLTEVGIIGARIADGALTESQSCCYRLA